MKEPAARAPVFPGFSTDSRWKSFKQHRAPDYWKSREAWRTPDPERLEAVGQQVRDALR